MKNISLWAQFNPKKTWLLITLAHFILVWLAYILSGLLGQIGYAIPSFIFPLSFLVFFFVIIVYPRKGWYYPKKACDFILALVGFVQFCFLFNSEIKQYQNTKSLFASTIINDSLIYKYPQSGKIITDFKKDHHKISKKESRILLKEFKYQSRKLVKNENAKDSDKTLEIILVILLALGIFVGIAALACGISCGGAEALAVIVLIGGLVLAILVAWGLIRNINKKKRINNNATRQKPEA